MGGCLDKFYIDNKIMLSINLKKELINLINGSKSYSYFDDILDQLDKQFSNYIKSQNHLSTYTEYV